MEFAKASLRQQGIVGQAAVLFLESKYFRVEQ
jgi:hypothetical protein